MAPALVRTNLSLFVNWVSDPRAFLRRFLQRQQMMQRCMRNLFNARFAAHPSSVPREWLIF